MNKNCYDNVDIILKPDSITSISCGQSKTKKLHITEKDVRKQLQDIGYICPYNVNTRNEYYAEYLENYALPFMNFIYYYWMFRLERIPTFEEFQKGYFQMYCDRIGKDTYTFKNFFDSTDLQFTEKLMIGRVFRSYNSFHREVDFLFQMAKYEDIEIQYRFKDDMNGIDFTIKYKDKIYGLASYLDTKRSVNYKIRKNTIRHDYSDIEMIDVIAKLNKEDTNCDVVKGIYLYSPKYIETMYNEIKKRYEMAHSDLHIAST